MSGLLSNFNLASPLSQTFRTIPVPTPGLALFTIALRAPSAAKLSFMTYTFPLSPQALRKEFTAMTAVYDIQGSPAQQGIQRIADVYGNSPFNFVIEGTTGQQRHSTDGYLFTGRQSIDQIMLLFGLYADLNQVQMANNDPNLFTMEFYNYFAQEFWQVVPTGPQGVAQTSQAPTLQFYRFRLAGIQRVNAPLVSNIFSDQIGQLFIAGASRVTGLVEGLMGEVLAAYL